ncbi:hypothetical protein GCM10028799_78460 [Kribbella italica]
MVIRDNVIIDWRVAPTSLAEAYANVLRLRYPNDQIRAKQVSDYEAAYPPDQPYDPRD